MVEGKSEWYDIHHLLENSDAAYYITLGLRSCGKSYSAKFYVLERFFKTDGKEEFAYVRRYDADITRTLADNYFTDINGDGVPTKLAKKYGFAFRGERLEVHAYRGTFVLQEIYKDVEGNEKARTLYTVGHILSVNKAERFKSASYANVKTVVFEEFMSREAYLGSDEPVKFLNLVSTIVRSNNDVKIVMIANTVSKLCPYFPFFGISMKDFKRGKMRDIKMESGATIRIEWVEPGTYSDDKYFGVENVHAGMITSGEWEHEDYNLITDPVSWKRSILAVRLEVCGCLAFAYLRPYNGYYVIDVYEDQQRSPVKHITCTDVKYSKDVSPYTFYKFNFDLSNPVYKIFLECVRNRRVRVATIDAGEIFRQMNLTRMMIEY